MKMKKKNKVLKDTTTFVIPRGEMVVVYVVRPYGTI